LFALKNAKVYTVTDGIINNGTILIDGSKIVEVGEDLEIPESAEIHDLKGKSVIPGIIDAHCHVGVFNEGAGDIGCDGNDYSNPITPNIKAADGIWMDDEAFENARNNGITTLCIGPGSANVIGGQMAVLKTGGNILEEMMLDDYVGLKCAFGENPKQVYGPKRIMPITRMGVAAVLRDALIDAKNYLAKKEHHKSKKVEKGKTKEPFELKNGMEIIGEVIEGKKPLRAHAHRADDIQTAIRIAEEFGLKIVIEHCTEGHKISEFLAKKGISAIIGPLDTTKPKVELKDATLSIAKELEKAGVKFAIMTDHPVKRIDRLFDDVRACVRDGLSKETALKSVTINPAEILNMGDRLGSISKGKDADLAIFDGDPFDYMAKVICTLIDGEVKAGKL